VKYSHPVLYTHEIDKAKKMCRSETYSRINLGKNLSDMLRMV
jgi:hypothetical protein